MLRHVMWMSFVLLTLFLGSSWSEEVESRMISTKAMKPKEIMRKFKNHEALEEIYFGHIDSAEVHSVEDLSRIEVCIGKHAVIDELEDTRETYEYFACPKNPNDKRFLPCCVDVHTKEGICCQPDPIAPTTISDTTIIIIVVFSLIFVAMVIGCCFHFRCQRSGVRKDGNNSYATVPTVEMTSVNSSVPPHEHRIPAIGFDPEISMTSVDPSAPPGENRTPATGFDSEELPPLPDYKTAIQIPVREGSV